MKSKLYSIKAPDGSWYEGHGKYNGSGCFRTASAKFPTKFYETKDEAGKAIDGIVRDFPNIGVNCSMISITFTMREVFA